MNIVTTKLTPDALAVVTLNNFNYVIIGCYKLDQVVTYLVFEFLIFCF